MEYKNVEKFYESSENLLFSELDCSKSFDEMIQESYLSHPTNLIYNSNCFYTDKEYSIESETMSSNLNRQEKRLVLKSNPITLLNNGENANKSFQNNRQELKQRRKNCAKKMFDLIEESKDSNKSSIKLIHEIKEQIKTNKLNHRSLEFKQNRDIDFNSNIVCITSNKGAFSSDKTKIKDSFTNHIVKFKRWGMKEDIQMFKLLRKELDILNINEERFFSINIEDAIDHQSKMIKDQMYANIINRLAIDTNWSRTPYNLLYRILRLQNNQESSVRNELLLKKLLLKRSCINQKDIRKIVESFPGKLTSSVLNKIRETKTHII